MQPPWSMRVFTCRANLLSITSTTCKKMKSMARKRPTKSGGKKSPKRVGIKSGDAKRVRAKRTKKPPPKPVIPLRPRKRLSHRVSSVVPRLARHARKGGGSIFERDLDRNAANFQPL